MYSNYTNGLRFNNITVINVGKASFKKHMNFLKLLKRYRFVISAIGVALAIYMGVYDITDKVTAWLLGTVFALLHLVIDDIE